jgi:hypothetical protein
MHCTIDHASPSKILIDHQVSLFRWPILLRCSVCSTALLFLSVTRLSNLNLTYSSLAAYIWATQSPCAHSSHSLSFCDARWTTSDGTSNDTGDDPTSQSAARAHLLYQARSHRHKHAGDAVHQRTPRPPNGATQAGDRILCRAAVIGDVGAAGVGGVSVGVGVW